MPKIKTLVVSVLIALAAAVSLTGCALFSSDTDNSEKLAAAKTVAKKVLLVVCTAYNSGGNTLAAAKIDDMVKDGKITETQAIALKSLIAGGVGVLEKIANREDSKTSGSASGTTLTETPATE